jgi:hypothetical protein
MSPPPPPPNGSPLRAADISSRSREGIVPGCVWSLIDIKNNLTTPHWPVNNVLRMNTRLRKNDKLIGESVERIFRHLEAKPNFRQTKRIEHILDLLARLGMNPLDREAWVQLPGLLERYKGHYEIVFVGKELEMRLCPPKHLSRPNRFEHGAVCFLLRLVPRNIDRLRRCAYEGCRGWFYAGKKWDQKFCARGACRQNNYDSLPANKEHKRELMRINRIHHKGGRGKQTAAKMYRNLAANKSVRAR